MITDKNSAYEYLRDKAHGKIQANEQDEFEVLKYFSASEIEEMSFNYIDISSCKKSIRGK